MKTPEILVLLLCLGSFRAVYAVDLYVDANLTSSDESTYTSLSNAITRLLISVNLDPMNTITLLNSTVEATQALPSNAVIQGTGIETLTIEFPFSQTVSQVQDCSLLPSIYISSDQVFQVSNLSTLSLIGLNILYTGSTSKNTFSSIGSVSFSNFCFNNSEPTLASSGSYPLNYEFNIAFNFMMNFSMINCVYLTDSLKKITVSNTSNVTISSITVLLLPFYHEGGYPALNVDYGDFYNSSVSISQFQIIIPVEVSLYPPVFSLENLKSVVISSFSIENVLSSAGSLDMDQDIITVNGVTSLIMENFNFNGCTFPSNVIAIPIYITDVHSILLTNFMIAGNPSVLSSADALILITDNVEGNNYPMNINLSNWTIQYNNLLGGGGLIEISITKAWNYGSLEINNMSIIACVFSSYSGIMDIQIALAAAEDSFTFSNTAPLELNGVTVAECTLGPALIFMLTDLAPTIYTSVAAFQFEITNFIIANNTIIPDGIILHSSTSAVIISEALIINNTWNYGELFDNEAIYGTLIIYNSVFQNNSLQQSPLIALNPGVSGIVDIELSMNASQTAVFAQTLPLIIYNCTFTNNTLEDGSQLIVSINPMILIQNTTFSNSIIKNSQLLKLGGYNYFITGFSLFYDPSTGESYPTDTKPSIPFPDAERVLFRHIPWFQQLFDDTRQSISEFDDQGAVYFINLQDNIFDSLQSYQNGELIMLDTFNVPNSSVIVLNNNFTSIITDIGTNLMTGNDILRIIVVNNTVKDSMIGPGAHGHMMYMTSTELITSSFVSNMFFDVTGLGFYYADVTQCDNVTMDQNYILSSQPTQNFISLTCTSYSSPIIIQNSIFNDIIQTNVQKILSSLNLISISVLMASQSGNGMIIFQNNNFKNVTLLNNEGSIQGIFQVSMIFVMAFDFTFLFQNNTLDTLTVTPEGNVMLISIPEIQFINSSFTNWSFLDTNGAITFLCMSVSITNGHFQANQGHQTNGIGLMNIINRLPSTNVLNVEIKDSVFEDNIGPYGTILYVESTPMQLSLSSVSLQNNYVNDTAGLIYLYNIYSTAVTITNCDFVSTQGSLTKFPELQIFTFESPGRDVSITINDSSIVLGGEGTGVVISVSNEETVSLLVSNLSFLPAPTDDIMSSSSSNDLEFSLLRADNIDAYFQNIEIENLNIQKVGLFVLNCDTKNQYDHLWNLTIVNATFQNLILSQGLVVVNSDNFTSAALDTLTILLQNSTFEDISWASRAGGIVTSLTSLIGKSQGDNFTINIVNCSFQNLSGAQGLIYNGYESRYDHVLWISQSRVQNLAASGSGGVINSALSLIQSLLSGNNQIPSLIYQITESVFERIEAESGGILYWESQSKGVSILFQDNSFENITCSGQGGAIYLQRNRTVNTLDQSFIDTNLVNFHSKNSSYIHIAAKNGGILYSNMTSQFLNINIEESAFKQINANQSGGVMQIISATNDSVSSTSRRLIQNTQQFLGNVTIQRSNFSSVSATDGGLVYENTLNNTLLLNLSKSTFDSSSVSSRGGVLFIKEPIVLVSDSIFTNCSATRAGPLIYSITNLVLQGLDLTNTITSTSSPFFSFGPTNLNVEFVSSGQTIQPENNPNLYTNPIFSNLTSYSLSAYNISLTLISENSQGSAIVPDESKNTIITLVFIPLNGGQNQIHIDTNCANSNCFVQAKENTLQGNAGDIVLVNASYSSALYTQFQQFYIIIRGCLPGEVNDTSTKGCVYCSYGTYSLNPNDTKCNDCPEGAICEGGATLYIQPGYYRSTNTSSLYIMSCNDSTSPRCEGGYNSSCIEGFTGPACLQCDKNNGYLPNSSECSKCHSKRTLITYGVLLLIISISYQVIIITMTFKENKKTLLKYTNASNIPSKALRPGAFMVLFASFCQICSVISDFDVGTVLALLGVTENFGNPNSQAFFSLRCLYYSSSSNDFDSLRFQFLVYVFSPLVKLFFVALFEIVKCLIWKGKSQSLIRLGAVAVSLIILEQPGIVGGLCDYLHCIQLDPYIDQSYISKYNTVQCYTPQYYSFRNVLVIPALIIWGLVIPVTIYWILRTKQEKLLGSLSFRLVFGNFYNSYVPEAYYCGVAIMIFKILIFILNSMVDSSPLAKCLIFICLFHIYYQIFKNNPPYHHKSLNRAEGYCYRSYMAVLTLVFFRISVEDSRVQTLCDTLIMFIIICTGGYMLINIFWLYIVRFLSLFDRYRIMKKSRKNQHQILDFLREYHKKNSSHRDEHYRRNGILLELPPNLRDTVNIETEIEALQIKRAQRIQNFTRRLYHKFAESITSKKSKNPEKKEKIVKNESFEIVKRFGKGISLNSSESDPKTSLKLLPARQETQERLLSRPKTSITFQKTDNQIPD